MRYMLSGLFGFYGTIAFHTSSAAKGYVIMLYREFFKVDFNHFAIFGGLLICYVIRRVPTQNVLSAQPYTA